MLKRHQFAIIAGLSFVLAPITGCGRAPLMHVESSNGQASKSQTPVNSANTVEVTSESKETDSTFLEKFQAIQETCNDHNRLKLEKIETQFSEPGMTLEQQDPLIKEAHRLNDETTAFTLTLLPEALALITPHATETAAIEPLIWIAQRGFLDDIGRDAASLLTAHHAVNQKTIELASNLERSGRDWVEPMLRAQVTSSELSDDQRPRQMLALARTLKTLVEYRHDDAKKLDEAIQLYREIAQKYSDKEYRGGITYGELASMAIFEIENLSVGKMAPDIDGEDLNEDSLKLSDYRGKVTMISFWATWCGPCMALVPHERELVKKYEGRPFVLIGVNGDMEKQTAAPVVASENITWRSFWCGSQGPMGPIPRKWNINSWPTVYLIDHMGIIKSKSLNDEMIEDLVIAAEKDLGSHP